MEEEEGVLLFSLHNRVALEAENATTYVTDETEYELNLGGFPSLILPRITAVLSLFAVVCVFLEAYQDLRRNRRQSVVSQGNHCRIRSTRAAHNMAMVHHIQLFYQVPLFAYSLALALGTTPVPKYLPVWGAAGTTTTCTLQGFLLQFGITGTVLWDAALSATYLIMTRRGQVRDRQKWICHLIIWPLILVVSLYPLATQLYNFSYNVCWIHEFPNNCHERGDCIRGEGAVVWTQMVSFAVMLQLIYSMTMMLCLYCTIRGMEDRTLLRASASTAMTEASSSTHRSRTYSKAVGKQGMLYTSGMIVTMLPTAIYMTLFNATGFWNEGFSVFALTMTPLVGYVNFLIFMRNKRVDDCHTAYAKLLRRAHSWLLDYDLRIRCECSCLPKWRRRGAGGTGVTDPTLKDDGPGPQQQSAPQPQQRQPQEADDCVGENRGLWTGLVVQLKNSSERVGAWISELGLSSMGRSETDDHWYDEAPNLPTRVKSQVEMSPTHPVRMVSELSATELMDVSDKTALPPLKPVRLASHVEEDSGTQQDCLPPSKPQRYQSEIEPIPEADETPPSQPIRFVSEIEPVPEEEPPSQPTRYTSEVEPILEGDDECQQPTTSEIELQTRGPSRATIDSSCEAPPAPVRHVVSEIEAQVATKPPSRPIRYTSEVEHLPDLAPIEDDQSNMEDSRTSSSRHSNPQQQCPPSKPIRYESEIEPVQKQRVAGPPTRRSSEASAAPPIRPIRYESEVESLAEEPPTKPIRYTSEMDDSG